MLDELAHHSLQDDARPPRSIASRLEPTTIGRVQCCGLVLPCFTCMAGFPEQARVSRGSHSTRRRQQATSCSHRADLSSRSKGAIEVNRDGVTIAIVTDPARCSASCRSSSTFRARPRCRRRRTQRSTSSTTPPKWQRIAKRRGNRDEGSGPRRGVKHPRSGPVRIGAAKRTQTKPSPHTRTPDDRFSRHQ